MQWGDGRERDAGEKCEASTWQLPDRSDPVPFGIFSFTLLDVAARQCSAHRCRRSWDETDVASIPTYFRKRFGVSHTILARLPICQLKCSRSHIQRRYPTAVWPCEYAQCTLVLASRSFSHLVPLPLLLIQSHPLGITSFSLCDFLSCFDDTSMGTPTGTGIRKPNSITNFEISYRCLARTVAAR